MGHLYHSLQGSGNTVKDGTERMSELEEEAERYGMLCPSIRQPLCSCDYLHKT